MDALHLASALGGRGDIFLTFDDKTLRLGLLEQMTHQQAVLAG